jgi:hypothetical protein
MLGSCWHRWAIVPRAPCLAIGDFFVSLPVNNTDLFTQQPSVHQPSADYGAVNHHRWPIPSVIKRTAVEIISDQCSMRQEKAALSPGRGARQSCRCTAPEVTAAHAPSSGTTRRRFRAAAAA